MALLSVFLIWSSFYPYNAHDKVCPKCEETTLCQYLLKIQLEVGWYRPAFFFLLSLRSPPLLLTLLSLTLDLVICVDLRLLLWPLPWALVFLNTRVALVFRHDNCLLVMYKKKSKYVMLFEYGFVFTFSSLALSCMSFSQKTGLHSLVVLLLFVSFPSFPVLLFQ